MSFVIEWKHKSSEDDTRELTVYYVGYEQRIHSGKVIRRSIFLSDAERFSSKRKAKTVVEEIIGNHGHHRIRFITADEWHEAKKELFAAKLSGDYIE